MSLILIKLKFDQLHANALQITFAQQNLKPNITQVLLPKNKRINTNRKG